MDLSKKSSGGEGEADDSDREHLDDVEDGCGCVEVWEELSEQREASD